MRDDLILLWRRPLSYRNQSIDLRTAFLMKGLNELNDTDLQYIIFEMDLDDGGNKSDEDFVQ